MSYLSESSINMLKYVATMFAFMFAVPITVQITSFILRTIDSFIRMQESIAMIEQNDRNLTDSVEELYRIIKCQENMILDQQQRLSDQNIHSSGISQNIDDLYEAVEIISDRILEDAAAAANNPNINVQEQEEDPEEEEEEDPEEPEPEEEEEPEPQPLQIQKATKTEIYDSPRLLQQSILRQETKEVFDQFIADCLRFRPDDKTSKDQLLRSFRKWFWSENSGPLCVSLSDQRILECMYEKFGYVTDEWKGVVFAIK
jgi:hypothetical protein